MTEPELAGGLVGVNAGVQAQEPQWKRYGASRRKANAAYEEREKCVGFGRRSRKRVVLSEETFQKWKRVKADDFEEYTNDEFATTLLDSFLSASTSSATSRPFATSTSSATSTPPATRRPTAEIPSNCAYVAGMKKLRMQPVSTSTPHHGTYVQNDSSEDVISVPSEVGSSSSGLSGIQQVDSSEDTWKDKELDVSVTYRHGEVPEHVDDDNELDDDDDLDDPDYDPDITIHKGPLPKELNTIGEEEEVMGELPPEMPNEPCGLTTRSGMHSKVTPEEAADARLCIASHSALKSLCREARGMCRQCGKVTDIKLVPSGTSVHVTWVCPDGHSSSWCAQETLERSHVGDMKLASAVVMTGNNFSKIRLLARFMSLNMISNPTFHAHQRKYVAPAIEEKWKEVQKEILLKHSESPVVVCGDGRNDSPGFCARYLTYVLMDHDSKDVLDVEIVEKRETRNSPAMELEGLKRALNKVEEAGVKVEELVTDAHPSITCYMREKKGAIRHSWDVWHAGKNLGKKVVKAAGKVSTKPLLYWVRHIVFHFWWCAQTCGRSGRSFIAKWRGLTHHVTDKHEWVAGLDGDVVQCSHDELPEREEWLAPGSEAHKALVGVCYDRKFLKNKDRFLTFRHTSTIESLNNHILMYASKRYSFGYRAFRARNYMAVIDYQAHKERPYKTDEEGNQKYLVRWSKHAGQYVTVGVKVAKTYPYIRQMMTDIFKRRAEDVLPLFSPVELDEHDPRHIRPRLAQLPLPSVNEILERRKSRFSV